MPEKPSLVAYRLRRARDDEEFLVVPALYGHVALEAALAVQHRRVGKLADAVGAHALEQRSRVAPAHQQLAERGLIQDADPLSDRKLFLDHCGKPVGAAERVLHRGAEIVRALPAELRAELRALVSQSGVER